MALTKTPIELSSTQGIVDNSNATAITIDSSENVGIGISSPSRRLHVKDSGSFVATFEGGTNAYTSWSNSTGTAGYIGSANGLGSGGITDLAVRSENNLIFLTNAGSERLRIDSSGNVLVGTTDITPGIGDTNAGISMSAVNGIIISRANDAPINISRNSSDGDLILFRKDGTTGGRIGIQGGDLYLGTDDANIKFFNSASIQPVNSVGGVRDNAIDLGASSARFKDLYLSGKVQTSYIYRADASGAGLHFTTNAIYPTNETTALSDGTESLGAAAYRFKDIYLSSGVVFGSTGGSVASKTLDDYEEGTWTPTYTDDSGNVITNLTSQGGTYVKVGNLVYISGNLRTQSSSSTSGLSGFLSISGLPFTQSSGTAGTVSFYTHVSVPTYNAPSELPRTSPLVSNTTRIAIYKYSGTGGRTTRFEVSDLNMSGNSNFMFFSGTYAAS